MCIDIFSFFGFVQFFERDFKRLAWMTQHMTWMILRMTQVTSFMVKITFKQMRYRPTTQQTDQQTNRQSDIYSRCTRLKRKDSSNTWGSIPSQVSHTPIRVISQSCKIDFWIDMSSQTTLLQQYFMVKIINPRLFGDDYWEVNCIRHNYNCNWPFSGFGSYKSIRKTKGIKKIQKGIKRHKASGWAQIEMICRHLCSNAINLQQRRCPIWWYAKARS